MHTPMRGELLSSVMQVLQCRKIGGANEIVHVKSIRKNRISLLIFDLQPLHCGMASSVLVLLTSPTHLLTMRCRLLLLMSVIMSRRRLSSSPSRVQLRRSVSSLPHRCCLRGDVQLLRSRPRHGARRLSDHLSSTPVLWCDC